MTSAADAATPHGAWKRDCRVTDFTVFLTKIHLESPFSMASNLT
jgi:hypothetical protein